MDDAQLERLKRYLRDRGAGKTAEQVRSNLKKCLPGLRVGEVRAVAAELGVELGEGRSLASSMMAKFRRQ